MRATIDRIEESVAVLIVWDGEPVRVNFPVSLLPQQCREGDIVTILIERDPEATFAMKKHGMEHVERLRKRE